ncbi:MAG TPA: hypothetical protein VK822_04505 [Acetobacteraceae bacterium]|jgi:hypothetical protein|nr:hypothetical protein [Acetobacteraceae bacterium]
MNVLLIAALVFFCGVLVARAMKRRISPKGQAQDITAETILRGPVLVSDAKIDVDLIYRNSIGEPLARRVTIHEVRGVGHRDGSVTLEHIDAYCHLRHAARTFRFDRMAQASDPETGELDSSPAALIARLCGLPNRVRPVKPNTDNAPLNTAAPRKVAVAPIEIDDGTVTFSEHFRVRVDTVYGNGAGFEGVARRAKTPDRRGWGGRKVFSVIDNEGWDHEGWRVRKATTQDGQEIADLAAWLQHLPDAPAT